jgi:tRNA A-37 threonylcarbamoyl transferase component Bud32
MALDSVAHLVQLLRQYRVLEPAQDGELAGNLLPLFAEPKALARELVRRGWLTPYQVNALFQGRAGELLLGHYVLLERLGAGGMGEVFKARNCSLGLVVALKLIRKERLGNPDLVRRFHREIRVAAQLSHPNIVQAFDADEVGGTHFFTMEYVPGVDLRRRVKEGGPLPVDAACDAVRQAALALQHAFEKGMVHRDVKPANLLVTGRGLVKVTDLGLARLTVAEGEESGSSLTQEGMVMGTVDFLAPEQALNSKAVDARADLYSLGCTLYYLLTGRVPFPGGTVTEKLLKHRFDEAVPVEVLRPQVSPGLGAVVRRLMAKEPEERYQTPAEVVLALAGGVPAGVVPGGGAEAVGWADLAAAVAGPPSGGAAGTAPPSQETLASPGRGARPPLPTAWLAAAGAAVLLGGLLLVLLLPRPGPPSPRAEAPANIGPARPWEATARGTAAAPDVIISQDPYGYRIRAPRYTARVEADGCMTSLSAAGVEFFNPAVSFSRGSYFYDDEARTVLRLRNLDSHEAHAITAKGDKASIRYEFARDSVSWTAANTGAGPLKLYIVFTPAVTAVREDEGEWTKLPLRKDWRTTTWLAGRAKVRITGGTRIWGPWTGGTQVWEATLSPQETRPVKLEVSEATEAEAAEAAAAAGP